MNLLQSLRGQPETRYSLADYLGWVLGPNGSMQPTLRTTMTTNAEETLGTFAEAYTSNGIVYAVELARLSLFSQARFIWRRKGSGWPGFLFGDPSLDILEHPWANATTGDLLTRALQDADLNGNAFFIRSGGEIKRLRPEWVTIALGSDADPDDPGGAEDAEIIGYVYHRNGRPAASVVFLPNEIVHFAPSKDPNARYRGISWLTPLLREVEADNAMTMHRLMYMRQGATPNLVVTGVPGATPEAFAEWVKKFGRGHDGVANAYKTVYLSGLADAKVVGNDLAQVDFRMVQAAGEVRIANAAGVPATVVGLTEGLQGSSLNAGNFASAMRRFADLTMQPLWQNFASSMSSIVRPPGNAELSYDIAGIPALKDDIKDAAEVQTKHAQAIRQYVDAGFEPDSVVKAVSEGDLTLLKHTGLYSVQLQPPMPEKPPEPAVIVAPVVPPALQPGKPA
jgi:phage portal protein BeeE